MTREITVPVESTVNATVKATRQELFALGMKLTQLSQDDRLLDNAGAHYDAVVQGAATVQALLAQLQMLEGITQNPGARGRNTRLPHVPGRPGLIVGGPQEPPGPPPLPPPLARPDEWERLEQREGPTLRLLDTQVPDAIYAGRDDIPRELTIAEAIASAPDHD